MSREQIVSMVEGYILQSQAGQTIEMSKFDCKAKWYDLKDLKGINEFVKDTSAIANTFGPDGFIVIGYDDKKKSFEKAHFSDCGLSDTSALTGIINKRVDRLFQFDVISASILNNDVNIIHIPPSFDKPHVIRNYETFKDNKKKEEQNKIFVRNNTTTKPASKYDLELMFWDRKNIIPEYEIYCSFDISASRCNTVASRENIYFIIDLQVFIHISFENTGRRPLAITDIHIDFSTTSEPTLTTEILKLKSSTNYRSNPIVVPPGSLVVKEIELNAPEFITNKNKTKIAHDIHEYLQQLHDLPTKNMVVRISNGTQIPCKLEIIN